MKRRGVIGLAVFLGIITLLQAEEDEWSKIVAAESKAADEDFVIWKSTGKVPESFEEHAIRGDRADLVQRIFAGDKLVETEIKNEAPATVCEVAFHDTVPYETLLEKSGEHTSVWRRITKDRFEIWTPKEGRLYDAGGRLLKTAKVRRGDGWGREWYGAFLPDGRWITTDINDFDKEVTAFSEKGKRLWSVKGATLIPGGKNPDVMNSTPLIAWARSDKNGKAWIVSVGSEWGRGFVKLKSDGKWSVIDDPWKECFPQQLRSRGMYLDRSTRSDDGSVSVNRTEAGHGMHVGWPHYHFPESDILVPNGDDFGILQDSRSVFIEVDCEQLISSSDEGTAERMKEREDERVWFFDTKGTYQYWIQGRSVGASLAEGGLWIRRMDDSCFRVGNDGAVKSRLKFVTVKKQALVPVELHDDIRLGLFLFDGKLLLGSWK